MVEGIYEDKDAVEELFLVEDMDEAKGLERAEDMNEAGSVVVVEDIAIQEMMVQLDADVDSRLANFRSCG